MTVRVAAILLLATTAMTQDPPPGIARELAAERKARLADVAYSLSFRVDPAEEHVGGSVRCTFDLVEGGEGDLVIDFGGVSLDDVGLNGSPIESPRRVADHVVLPADRLQVGENVFTAGFRSRVAPTGTPLTRYDDEATGRSWFYTLLVPSDAHHLFPCFDQPDLKARFDLALEVPTEWAVVANGPQTAREESADGGDRVTFATTEPLPTYLFAFATGPFTIVHEEGTDGDAVGAQPLRIFLRDSKREHLEAERLFEMHRDAVDWLTDYFGAPYPFAKLDIVLLPGFPYGGMEHAGAIFYRESALVFEREPTSVERHRRSTLVYHEVAHQWFGNLVTMEWFDDLWLKEGFATFVAYRVLEELEPDSRAWLRFLQRVKPAAYRIDATDGTTPIWQELANLDDAKSAYGPIVYNKAPAVLRELEARLGEDDFRSGVRLFLARHAFGNARWQDLVAAFRDASGLHGSRWSDRWILSAGMPRVRVEWEADDGRLTRFAVEQANAADRPWPLALDVMLIDTEGGTSVQRVRADEIRTEVPELVGGEAPAAVLLNPGDVAYGEFVLDERSQAFLMENLSVLGDPLVRAVAIAGLWQAVRDAALDPARFADLLLDEIAAEGDPLTHAGLLDMLATSIGRYLGEERAAPLLARAEEAMRADLQSGREGLELQTVRFLARYGRSEATLALLRGILHGELDPPGLAMDDGDRFELAAALVAAGDQTALQVARERADADADVAKEEFMAGAAAADAAVKADYFATYLQLGQPPEQWMQESLGYFHWPGQSELTLPWLDNALERALWVKTHRRIFFMPAWIDAFVNAHATPEALAIVERYLERERDLPIDVRRKVLQSVDDLRRAVRIRELYGSSGR